MWRNALVFLVSLVLCIAGAGCASAQSYPNQRVRLVVPYPAGGGADFVARLVAPLLAERLGQDVYVDNRGGAGGVIGAEIVAKAPPDGYTVQLAASNLSWITSLFKDVAFDPKTDFAAVSLLAQTPSILAVNPAFPAKSVEELLRLAKQKPGKINYAGGVGTSMHTDTELFKAMAHIDLTEIPYKGTSQAVAAALSGEAPIIIGPTAAILPQVKSGNLRALAITSDQRVALLPDLPTIAESGVPKFETVQWYGAFVPSHTPRDVIKVLNNALVEAVRTPAIAPQWANQILMPVGDTPEEFAAYYNEEIVKWAQVLKPVSTPQ